MIDKKQFEEASNIIKLYNEQINKSLITSRICACCKITEIKPLEDLGLSEGYIKSTEQEQGCWAGGTVEKISFGYGSRNDNSCFYVAICDDCIERLEKDGLATNVKSLYKQEREHLR